jgi:bacterioferritin (cytochrome b1)
MEKLSTKKQLIEGIKDLLAVEILARESYKNDVLTFNNFKLVDTIEKIKIDEDRHINMLKELITLLEKKKVD